MSTDCGITEGELGRFCEVVEILPGYKGWVYYRLRPEACKSTFNGIKD